MTKLRPIVRAAFKCDALVYQFTVIDLEDGLIEVSCQTAHDEIISFVNERYDDDAIIREAENRLDICNDWINQQDPEYIREARQLRAFLKRFKKAA